MSEPQRVFVASGDMHAEQVRGFLAAHGIATAVRAESLRATHGLTIDGAGAVQILVAAEDANRARTLLASAEAGELRLADDHDAREVLTPSSRTRFEHANPILRVANLERSVAYYVDVLGFSNADWASDDFTCVTRDGASIYLCEGDQGHPGTWVWLGVDDVAALHEEYLRSGASILHAPENYPWALEMKVSDPDGHVLRFGSDPLPTANSS